MMAPLLPAVLVFSVKLTIFPLAMKKEQIKPNTFLHPKSILSSTTWKCSMHMVSGSAPIEIKSYVPERCINQMVLHAWTIFNATCCCNKIALKIVHACSTHVARMFHARCTHVPRITFVGGKRLAKCWDGSLCQA